MDHLISELWEYAKQHDAPNWFAILVSFVWPLTVWALSRRTVQGIPHLDVVTKEGQTTIGGRPFRSMELEFCNRTGQVAYVSRVRIRENPNNLPVPYAAVREVTAGWRELKFASGEVFVDDEVILQTGQRAVTSIALENQLPAELNLYNPNLVRRLFRRPMYFALEYIAMVGTTKYSVATIV